MEKSRLLAELAMRELEYRHRVADNFTSFARHVMPSIEMSRFHSSYYHVLNMFAKGEIRRLIVSCPPQHGKSLAATQLLPAYMLGINPDVKLCIASYSATLAGRFNKRVQRTITDSEFTRVFPTTKLKSNSDSGAASYVQTSDRFEVVGRQGSLISAGREGSITGNAVDVMIMDDLYKDAMEGNSPQIRDNVWDWYLSVVKTRLHNHSQELIVFTRWNEDDLIGRMERQERVVGLTSIHDITDDPNVWYKLNFEAIKESDPTSLDPRSYSETLWPARHNIENLTAKRKLDRLQFDCMYQGRPQSKEGVLYGDNLQTYSELPDDNNTIKKANYTDTADTGEDHLCSICYNVGQDRLIYITDILYTREPMEVTEPATASMLKRNRSRIFYIESNNGGRGFARTIARLTPSVRVEWFHQSGNKESRILTNAATVLQNIRMPEDWKLRWPEFSHHITMYKRLFRANKNDDCADVLSGIIEKEVLGANERKIRAIRFSN